MSVSVTLETITPEIARRMLARNASNRKIRRSAVKEYARQMKNGMWQVTHQGLAFNEKGELVDGQHRCLAIIESGAEIKIFVARGFKADSHKSLMVDTGTKRSFSDVYGTDKRLSQVCSFIARIATGEKRLSAAEVKPYYDAFHGHAGAVLDGVKKNIPVVTSSPAVAAAVIARLMDIDSGGDGQYAINAYKRIWQMRSSEWTSAEASFCRGVMSGDIRSTDKEKMFSKCLPVFLKTGSSSVRLHYSSVRLEKASAFIKDYINAG